MQYVNTLEIKVKINTKEAIVIVTLKSVLSLFDDLFH